MFEAGNGNLLTELLQFLPLILSIIVGTEADIKALVYIGGHVLIIVLSSDSCSGWCTRGVCVCVCVCVCECNCLTCYFVVSGGHLSWLLVQCVRTLYLAKHVLIMYVYLMLVYACVDDFGMYLVSEYVNPSPSPHW